MSEEIIKIQGGRRLSGGRIDIAGSSNQVTKCIIASLLTDDPVLIKGVPDVNEKRIVERLYKFLGGSVSYPDKDDLRVCAKDVSIYEISEDQCMRNRISILAAGPLLHRFSRVVFEGPLGGDKIGKRPVDFHVAGLVEMGAKTCRDGDRLELSVGPEGLQGANITLPFPSVMATENLLIAASKARGRTIISNAAIEPEIIELMKMLQKMGADITLNPNRTYVVEGVRSLGGCELRLMIDRNQAVSFALAALATGGDVLLEKVPHDPVYSFLNFIQRMGAEFLVNSEGLFVKATKGGLRGAHMEVDVHPGFMTDWQQPFMVLFTQAHGVSVLHETVFENRLGYTDFLKAMGAKITTSSKCLGEVPCRFKGQNFIHSAIVQGPTHLKGMDFTLPTDIRAGKCLVIAGLSAEGTTRLSNIQELQRKYDNIVGKLQQMGADITVTSAN